MQFLANIKHVWTNTKHHGSAWMLWQLTDWMNSLNNNRINRTPSHSPPSPALCKMWHTRPMIKERLEYKTGHTATSTLDTFYTKHRCFSDAEIWCATGYLKGFIIQPEGSAHCCDLVYSVALCVKTTVRPSSSLHYITHGCLSINSFSLHECAKKHAAQSSPFILVFSTAENNLAELENRNDCYLFDSKLLTLTILH